MCRICRLGYSVKYGWGWDHPTQQVVPVRTADGKGRGTCMDGTTGLVAYPMRETWVVDGSEISVVAQPADLTKNDPDQCGVKMTVSTYPISDTGLVRRLWDHDGVTDMEIAESEFGEVRDSKFKLRLALPLDQSSTIVVPHDQSRIVLMANESIAGFLHKEDVPSSPALDITIDRPMRLRWIVEDLDTHHKEGGRMKESYFSSVVVDEFLHPLQMESSWTTATKTKKTERRHTKRNKQR
ncbi:MAG: hypothetical protein SGARI_002772 [Bacillariaceae sp.]